MSRAPCNVRVVFSDLDGTLVHYPKHFLQYADIVQRTAAHGDEPETATIKYKRSNETRTCVVLPSMTGGKAYLSVRTKQLVAQLRRMGVIFVIITGARASTYAARRRSLPAADYEFFENGGRKLVRGQLDAGWSDRFAPQVGPIADRTSVVPRMAPPAERRGTLWQLHSELRRRGWSTDARDYTTNFRVDVAASGGKTALELRRVVQQRAAPLALASSYNLGKADVYPAASGKANAARHVLRECAIERADAVAIFDDDNDLELGALCARGFLPGVTHDSVASALKEHPQWTVSARSGFLATEDALEQIIALRRAALGAATAG